MLKKILIIVSILAIASSFIACNPYPGPNDMRFRETTTVTEEG